MNSKIKEIFSILRTVLLISLCFAFFIYFFRVNQEYELPFFYSNFAKWFNYIWITILFLIIYYQTFKIYTLKDREYNQSFRSQKKKKFFLLLLMYGFAFLVAIFVGSFIIKMCTDVHKGLLQKLNPYIGQPTSQNFQIRIKTYTNPTYKQKINIGTTKFTRYIIDPAVYKLQIILIHGQRQYPLEEYCYTSHESFQIKNPIKLSGKESFFGFSCGKECSLSQFLTKPNGENMMKTEFSTCFKIYTQSPKI